MEKLHDFEQNVVGYKCKDKILENVNEFKLLGINNTQKSQLEKTYKQYDKELVRNTQHIKRYSPPPVRKQLAESIILSKLDYCNELLFDNPK